jgi:type II secretory pathway pseudopilin PulG
MRLSGMSSALRQRAEPDGVGPDRDRQDGGYTIVEFIVAMGIFTVLLAIFMVGMVNMTKATVRTQNTADESQQSRKVFSTFDHNLRYSTAYNIPGQGASGNWYVEALQESETVGVPPTCIQYKVDVTGRTLQQRQWPSTTPVAGEAGWSTVAYWVQPTGTLPPFSMPPTDASFSKQRIQVQLSVSRKAGAAGVALNTTYIARNSTNGRLPTTAVCTGVTRS